MPQKPKNVYQIKVTLDHTNPKIWRRILVPESYTFWDLHMAIQDSMGWEDSHLHQFVLPNPNGKMGLFAPQATYIGISDDMGFGDIKILKGWEEKISDRLLLDNPKVSYEYDFGDDWQHSVVLEQIIPSDEGVKYPICTAGKMACPPEDCGGVWGYEHLLEVLDDPAHDEHEDRLEWLGDKFDPERFDPKDVTFSNPKKELKALLAA